MDNRKKHTLSLGLSALCAAITAAGAQITIPIFVPITLQVFGVFLAGYILGPKWGAFSMLIYLITGLAGLPVFANAQGSISVIFLPTFGYLLAFPISAFAIGAISKTRFCNGIKIILSISLGIVIIYTFGVIWLLVWSKYIVHKPMILIVAISVGVFPFIIIDIFKGIAAYYIAKSIPKRIFAKLK